MLKPVLLTVLIPIGIGVLFGLQGIGGFIIGMVVASIQLSLSFIISGGCWENAKGYLEQYD